jgi:hypothetical protein
MATVTTNGDPASGNFSMMVTQMADNAPVDPPPVDPPHNPGNPPVDQDNWSQPEQPPKPAVWPGSGRVVRVGRGGHSTIAAAIAAASDGDTIEIPSATPREPFMITKNLSIRADGVKWDFSDFPSGNLAGGGKAVIVPASAASIIYGFEISGAGLDASHGDLTAALRNESAGWCTITDCYFHGNQNGIASGYYNAVMEVKRVRLQGNGLNPPGEGQTHNLYVNQINQLTMEDCESWGPTDGHALKFRGYRLIIKGGRYESSMGRSIDVPDGGKFTVTGATFDKDPQAVNGTMIGYMSESNHSGISHENELIGCTINALRQGSNQIHTGGGLITFASDTVWNGKLTVDGGGVVHGLPA